MDARFVGYGSMLLESILALVAVTACVAGFKSSQDWFNHYATWSSAAGLSEKLGAFVDGAAYFISGLGIPLRLGKTFIVLIIISFAMTTLDSACRLGRYIISEFADRHGVPVLKNRYVASAIVAGLAFMLAVGSYGGKPAGLILWPLFGTTNQLLASLVFATITIYLLKRKGPTLLTTIPLVLVSITTVCAMIWNIKSYIQDGNWVLFIIGSTILIAGFVLIYLSCSSYVRTRKQLSSESTKEG